MGSYTPFSPYLIPTPCPDHLCYLWVMSMGPRQGILNTLGYLISDCAQATLLIKKPHSLSCYIEKISGFTLQFRNRQWRETFGNKLTMVLGYTTWSDTDTGIFKAWAASGGHDRRSVLPQAREQTGTAAQGALCLPPIICECHFQEGTSCHYESWKEKYV